jgi:hypothetical protein
MYLNIIKAIYDRPIVNIILNEEKLKPSPLNSRVKSYSTVLEFLAIAIRQEEEIKGIQ